MPSPQSIPSSHAKQIAKGPRGVNRAALLANGRSPLLDYAGEGVLQTFGVTAVPDLEASEHIRQVPTAGEGLAGSASTHIGTGVRHRIVNEVLEIESQAAHRRVIGNVGNNRPAGPICPGRGTDSWSSPHGPGVTGNGRRARVPGAADGLGSRWLVEPYHDETRNGVVVAARRGWGLGEPHVVGCIVVAPARATGPFERGLDALHGADLLRQTTVRPCVERAAA